MSDFDITEAHRRIANMIQVGTVVKTDYSGAGRYRVRIGDLLTGWLPYCQLRSNGDVSDCALDKDEQVVVVAPSGELSQGFIIATLHTDAAPALEDRGNVRRAVFADGTVMEYDRAKHHFNLSIASGSLTITAPQGITINGDVTVDGDVTASGVSLVDHVHGDVRSGGDKTGKPDA